ncbi:MAG: sugar phosphate isomerase/epimerase [Sedimentisphaerales bacterium]|nr:sugar phosphate isomerase/epimerase [Sedimentisphaerales bacterium]
MRQDNLSRRRLLTAAGVAVGAAAVPSIAKAVEKRPAGFTYCLNTGTIRGQKLTIDKEVEVAAKAGYDAIEPWLDGINRYKEAGGSLKDLKKMAGDLGITVESAISFPSWIVDDDAERAKGFEQVKREMDLLAQIGGKRIAAPPAGATREPGLNLDKAAERYRRLLELGDETGVTPQLEIWGFSQNLHRLGEAMYVVVESGHPKACFIPDIFHIYKGGSDFNGLKAIGASVIQVFHMNDYHADPPREQARDSDRIFPGDGIAPITQIIRDLLANHSSAVLSLELFNPIYYQQDPLAVAKTGLEKMKSAVEKPLSTG